MLSKVPSLTSAVGTTIATRSFQPIASYDAVEVAAAGAAVP